MRRFYLFISNTYRTIFESVKAFWTGHCIRSTARWCVRHFIKVEECVKLKRVACRTEKYFITFLYFSLLFYCPYLKHKLPSFPSPSLKLTICHFFEYCRIIWSDNERAQFQFLPAIDSNLRSITHKMRGRTIHDLLNDCADLFHALKTTF